MGPAGERSANGTSGGEKLGSVKPNLCQTSLTLPLKVAQINSSCGKQ